jgi:hypothetical protein
MLALLLAVAHEKSKTPFYVIGACFAAWAVLIAVLGFTRRDFPGGDAQMRVVMGTTILLAGASVASAVLTS